MLSFLPLTLVVLIIYNLIVLLKGELTLAMVVLDTPLPRMSLEGDLQVALAERSWQLHLGEALIVLALFALYIEIFKATKANNVSVIDHTLSMLVFIAYLIQFLLIDGAGNSVFFILMIIALIDVVAGFTVSIITARRVFGAGP